MDGGARGIPYKYRHENRVLVNSIGDFAEEGVNHGKLKL